MNVTETNLGSSVLIIDDDQGLLDILSRSLSERGYRVETARSGEAGVSKAKAQPFDVVLCDIVMPGMGGIGALEVLKEMHPMTEVIMITGYATENSGQACKELGAFDYIAKPYEMDRLCEMIGKAIDRTQSAKRGLLPV